MGRERGGRSPRQDKHRRACILALPPAQVAQSRRCVFNSRFKVLESRVLWGNAFITAVCLSSLTRRHTRCRRRLLAPTAPCTLRGLRCLTVGPGFEAGRSQGASLLGAAGPTPPRHARACSGSGLPHVFVLCGSSRAANQTRSQRIERTCSGSGASQTPAACG